MRQWKMWHEVSDCRRQRRRRSAREKEGERGGAFRAVGSLEVAACPDDCTHTPLVLYRTALDAALYRSRMSS